MVNRSMNLRFIALCIILIMVFQAYLTLNQHQQALNIQQEQQYFTAQSANNDIGAIAKHLTSPEAVHFRQINQDLVNKASWARWGFYMSLLAIVFSVVALFSRSHRSLRSNLKISFGLGFIVTLLINGLFLWNRGWEDYSVVYLLGPYFLKIPASFVVMQLLFWTLFSIFPFIILNLIRFEKK